VVESAAESVLVPPVDVVIIHHNTLDLTSRCIQSLLDTAGELVASIVVVDNASSDGSGNELRARFPSVSVLRRDQPLSYAAACNDGARYGTAPYLLLSNSDVEYQPGCIGHMIGYMEQHLQVGVCSPLQRYPDGRRQRSWGYFPGWQEIAALMVGIETIHNRRGHRDSQPRAVPYCDGAVLFCRRAAYQQIGGMDERFSFFCEDADLCYRLWQKQWHCHFVPDATVIHHRGGTWQRSLEQMIAYEQQNMAAKLLFAQVQHAPARRLIPLGYAGVLQLFQVADAMVRSLPLQRPRRNPHRRVIRQACIAFLLQRHATK